MLTRTKIIALATILATTSAWAKHHHHHDHDEGGAAGLADVTLLVVRHAEKPTDEGNAGLAPAGEARAKAYATYFQHFTFEGAPVHVDALIASADPRESARPRLTLEPLAKATGMQVQTPFANKQYKDAALAGVGRRSPSRRGADRVAPRQERAAITPRIRARYG